MQPQIVVPDAGQHNRDLAGATRRILTSGAWKKQRVVVVLPAGAMLPARTALALWNLVFPPNNGVYRMGALGMEVGEAYTQTYRWVLAHPELAQWEYLLTVEHDNLPPSDGVLRLIESMEAHPEYTAISGLYWTKGEGGVPQIWGDPEDPVLNFRPQAPKADTLQECCGIGMGFALWSLRLLRERRLPDPIFKTVAGASGMATQDLYFWGEARKHGHRCAVDTRVKVGHYDVERDIVW